MKVEFTAMLTGNRRDVATGSPKALLKDIEGFDRDHCWVEINEAIEAVRPLSHQKPIKVKVIGKVKKYKRRGMEDSITCTVLEIYRIK